MKNLVVIFLLLSSLSVSSQQVYDTFLKEGKVWNYCDYDLSGNPNYTFTLFVQGDTIIEGNSWKKIYMNDVDHYQYALREDNHAVYI